MSYKLSIENETYPVEDIHFLGESTLTREAVGKTFSFVSPVRLTIGQLCVLRGEAADYQLLINGCLGFTFTARYFVSGIIAHKEVGIATAA